MRKGRRRDEGRGGDEMNAVNFNSLKVKVKVVLSRERRLGSRR